MRIWKYPIPYGRGGATHAMPRGARPLYANVVQEEAVIYMLVDADAAQRPRRVQVVGTGEWINAVAEWLPMGVLKMGSAGYGDLVWHVFLEREDA